MIIFSNMKAWKMLKNILADAYLTDTRPQIEKKIILIPIAFFSGMKKGRFVCYDKPGKRKSPCQVLTRLCFIAKSRAWVLSFTPSF